MALSIKTDEADALARKLAKLTGESLTEAVTVALRERFERVREHHTPAKDMPKRLKALAGRMRASYDTRPVNRSEWDGASGDSE